MWPSFFVQCKCFCLVAENRYLQCDVVGAVGVFYEDNGLTVKGWGGGTV